MSLKEDLLSLAKTYEDIKKEAQNVVSKVKSKVTDLTDKQRLDYLSAKSEFSMKTNFSAVVDLAERHEVNITVLNNLYKKYQELEKSIKNSVKNFEEVGIKEISIGPKAIGGFCKDGSAVYMHINLDKKGIDVKIRPADEDSGWNQQFEMFAHHLKKDIDRILG